ncbi:MAG: macro domain-containing protein [Candidatus Eisenbacteria bacterium]
MADRHIPAETPEIVLAAIDTSILAAWRELGSDMPWVRTHNGSIVQVECDAVVSPSNSFGFLDGGIDLIYSHHFGWHVQDRLQELIREKHDGELLVGRAEIVSTGHESIPYLISAPTMRVPQPLGESVHPYLAARAVLLLWRDGTFPEGEHAGRPVREVVHTIAIPGLGTGTGRVPAEAFARQLRAAIDDVLLGGTPFPGSWIDAAVRHARLTGVPLVIGEDDE